MTRESLKVLLIEEVEADIQLILQELQRGGFAPNWMQVRTAADLQAALQKDTWDVVIADYRLPRFDAPAALAIVKHCQPDVPFIVVSGAIGLDAAAVDLMKAGAHDYLTKDNLLRLAEAVRREIRESQMRAQRKAAEALLAKRDRYLTALVAVQQHLLTTTLSKAVYQQILTVLGPVSAADRLLVFEKCTDATGACVMHRRAEWCAPGIQPPLPRAPWPSRCSAATLPRWWDMLGQGAVINGSIANFPESEQAILAAEGICSLLIIPLIVNSEFVGFISFEDYHEQKQWDALEVDILRSAVAAISLAKEREQATQALARLNWELEDRVAQRTAELQASEAKLQAILDFAPAVIYVKDLAGRYLLVNRAFLSLFNCSLDTIIGKTDREFFSPTIVAKIDANDRTLMTKRQFQECEEEFEIEGKIYTFLSHKFLLCDRKNKPYALCGISINISDRKQAEQSLRESQKFIETVLDTVPVSVFWKDRQSVYLGCNRKFAQAIGVASPSEIIGKTDFDILPNEATGYQACDRTVMTSGQAQLGIIETLTRSDSSQRCIETHKAPLYDWAGNIVGVVGTFEDITDRRQAELQLQRTNKELLQATRLKDEFLANMSHELRTPLNAILGMAEVLQEDIFGPTTAQQQQALQTIERSGTHLLELINDILDIAKIEAGKMELEQSATAVDALCHASLAFVKQQALKKHIQLTLKLPHRLPDLWVDERRIRQVLINLLNNAVKFTPEGGQVSLEVMPRSRSVSLGESRSVSLGESCSIFPGAAQPLAIGESPPLATDQPSLAIAVRDTGIGIAPEHLSKLFQPFVQIDSALNRQYTGTGLGLALVKRIVELHGSEVTVTSELGVGSCFTITLPCTSTELATPAVGGAALIADLAKPRPTAFPLILLAEDNEANISTLSSYLKARGYRIVLAKNGQEAIAVAQAEQPDLILIDVQMPGMDGLVAMQHIRQHSNLANTPMIALSALAMAGDRDRCLAAGANAYLSKPIKLKELISLMQTLLAD